ncbi:MAG: hypothetical protein GY711_31770 [bacterium]|nr:hypothetical protein [bacterium]
MPETRESPSWKRTLANLAAALYVPQLLPFLGLGPLRECNHCLEAYAQYFPVVPGAFLAFGLGHRPGHWAIGFTFVWTVGFLVLRALRAHRKTNIVALVLIALLSTVNALGFTVILRS